MKRFLAALGEVDFPSDDNEWMLSNDFQKAKQLKKLLITHGYPL